MTLFPPMLRIPFTRASCFLPLETICWLSQYPRSNFQHCFSSPNFLTWTWLIEPETLPKVMLCGDDIEVMWAPAGSSCWDLVIKGEVFVVGQE